MRDTSRIPRLTYLVPDTSMVRLNSIFQIIYYSILVAFDNIRRQHLYPALNRLKRIHPGAQKRRLKITRFSRTFDDAMTAKRIICEIIPRYIIKPFIRNLTSYPTTGDGYVYAYTYLFVPLTTPRSAVAFS